MAELPLHFQTISELSRQIHAGTVSPVELTEQCLARIEVLDPRLNAFRMVIRERALAAAHEAADDETTIEAEERLGRDMSYEAELHLLKRESEMTVDELRKKYADMGEEEKPEETDEMIVDGDEEDDTGGSAKRKRAEDENDDSTKRSRLGAEGDTSEDGLAALNALEASAERAQQTLATRPFLLAGWVKLRKYQQVGLNWLVSLQGRRLNGILADVGIRPRS